jgi:hypothetical protein
MKKNEKPGLTDLASENPELNNKIATVLTKLENIGVTELEEQVAVLMTNMMNFFAGYAEEIPTFDTLSPEKQEFMQNKFKEVAAKLAGQEIKSVDEMLQTFVFVILSSLGENIDRSENLTAEEIANKKNKKTLRDSLRNIAAHEIYDSSRNKAIEEAVGRVNKSVLLGVRKALKKEGLEPSKNMDKEVLKALDDAHKDFKMTKQRERKL